MYKSTILNVVTVQNFEVVFIKFNVYRICALQFQAVKHSELMMFIPMTLNTLAHELN